MTPTKPPAPDATNPHVRRFWELRDGIFFETMGVAGSLGRKIGRIRHGALIITADYAKRASGVSAFTARAIASDIAQSHADETGLDVCVTSARGGKTFAIARPRKAGKP